MTKSDWIRGKCYFNISTDKDVLSYGCFPSALRIQCKQNHGNMAGRRSWQGVFMVVQTHRILLNTSNIDIIFECNWIGDRCESFYSERKLFRPDFTLSSPATHLTKELWSCFRPPAALITQSAIMLGRAVQWSVPWVSHLAAGLQFDLPSSYLWDSLKQLSTWLWPSSICFWKINVKAITFHFSTALSSKHH